MNTNATETNAVQASAIAAPLQIVLTYDHPIMANAARKMLNGFLSKWAADVDVHRDEWSFAELENSQCRSEALELATHCDLFIVALTTVADLPDSFKDWLDDWLQSRAAVETALILYVSSGGNAFSSSPVFARLRSLAAAHGMAFFATTVDLPPSTLTASVSPKSLLARLNPLDCEFPPESSGLNE